MINFIVMKIIYPLMRLFMRTITRLITKRRGWINYELVKIEEEVGLYHGPFVIYVTNKNWLRVDRLTLHEHGYSTQRQLYDSIDDMKPFITHICDCYYGYLMYYDQYIRVYEVDYNEYSKLPSQTIFDSVPKKCRIGEVLNIEMARSS